MFKPNSNLIDTFLAEISTPEQIGVKNQSYQFYQKSLHRTSKVVYYWGSRCWKVALDESDKHVFDKNHESLRRVTR